MVSTGFCTPSGTDTCHNWFPLGTSSQGGAGQKPSPEPRSKRLLVRHTRELPDVGLSCLTLDSQGHCPLGPKMEIVSVPPDFFPGSYRSLGLSLREMLTTDCAQDEGRRAKGEGWDQAHRDEGTHVLSAHVQRRALKGNCDAIGLPLERGLAASGDVWLEVTGLHLFSLSDNLAQMHHFRKQDGPRVLS